MKGEGKGEGKGGGRGWREGVEGRGEGSGEGRGEGFQIDPQKKLPSKNPILLGLGEGFIGS